MNQVKHATVKDIQVLENAGPWKAKSDGDLNVLFKIPFDNLIKNYFSYDQSELNKISSDIRGLRSYRVSNLSKGAIGANEWHKLRNELVFMTRGSFRWTCKDVYGDISEYILDSSKGLWIPPFILHTYESLENDAEILVLANTLFMPDDPSTHDSFDFTSFDTLVT